MKFLVITIIFALFTVSCTTMKTPNNIRYHISEDGLNSVMYISKNIAIHQWKQTMPGEDPVWWYSLVHSRVITEKERKEDELHDPHCTGDDISEPIVICIQKISFDSKTRTFTGVGSKPRENEDIFKDILPQYFKLDIDKESIKFVNDNQILKEKDFTPINSWYSFVVKKYGWDPCILK